MQKIEIKASKSYDVLIGNGLLEKSGEHIRDAIKGARTIALISDENVAAFYAPTVKTSLKRAGFRVIEYTFPSGERSKSAQVFIDLLEFLAKNELTRSDALAALGGGVAGDLVGFAASAYLRGVDFVQIPTTLLAAVDSSVGGKTAINLKAGKNLAGAFYQPSLVLCSTDTLGTLPEIEFKAGLCECIKCAVIKDKELFQVFLSGDCKNDLENMIRACVEIKGQVVLEDEFDRGERQKLNFGHSAAHAIEILSDFEINHGLAVGMGMVVEAKGAAALGICDKSVADDIEAALTAHGIDFACPFSAAELYEHTLFDKKRSGESINLILPTEIGNAVIYKMKTDDILPFYKSALGEK